MLQGRYVGYAGWGFLAIVGVILMWAGFTGRVGALMGAIFTPNDMIAPDSAAFGGGGSGGGF